MTSFKKVTAFNQEAFVILLDNSTSVVTEYGVVPLPPQSGNYSKQFITDYGKDLKPLDTIQSDSASFKVEGHKITWQKGQFKIGFTLRVGLFLYTIDYKDK